jgi:hypothetical protein
MVQGGRSQCEGHQVLRSQPWRVPPVIGRVRYRAASATRHGSSRTLSATDLRSVHKRFAPATRHPPTALAAPIDRAGLLLAPHSTHASTGNYSETNSTTMPSTPSTQTTNAAASSLFSHCMRRRSECRRGTRHRTREVQRCRQRESGRTAHLDDQHTASVSRPGGGSSSVATAYLGLYDHFSHPPCAGERVDKSGRKSPARDPGAAQRLSEDFGHAMISGMRAMLDSSVRARRMPTRLLPHPADRGDSYKTQSRDRRCSQRQP